MEEAAEVEYRVEAGTGVDDPTSEELDRVTRALGHVSGRAHVVEGQLAATLSIEARGAEAAVNAAIEALLNSLRAIGRTRIGVVWIVAAPARSGLPPRPM